MELESPRSLIDQARDIIRGCVGGDEHSTLTPRVSEDLAVAMVSAFHCGHVWGDLHAVLHSKITER